MAEILALGISHYPPLVRAGRPYGGDPDAHAAQPNLPGAPADPGRLAGGDARGVGQRATAPRRRRDIAQRWSAGWKRRAPRWMISSRISC